MKYFQMSGQQPGYYQPGLVRMRPKTEVSRQSVMRYSGDFDLITRTATRDNNNGPRNTTTNMFRRAKSSEWDRDVLNNNISDLR